MARVLVGVPTLNRPALVRETVRSVQAQRYGDWQAIVSDNLSQVAAITAVRNFVAGLDDPRIHFCAQPENTGEYGQGRFFFEQAQQLGCDYLVILHDDDLMDGGFIAAAVAALDAQPQAAFYVCNPTIIDEHGRESVDGTRQFDERWQRRGVPEGLIDVLDTHMASGFTPITGAFFRVSALQHSGFVDADLRGCFPFESNVFLRLGERGACAWFDPRRLLQVRWHSQQMTNWGFLNQEDIVTSTIVLFQRRRFTGLNEKRRRQLLGRLHRVRALHRARAGDAAATRSEAWQALKTNPVSWRSWLLGPLALLLPMALGAAVRRWFGPSTFSAA